MTVTGMTLPSALKIWVMPTFLPMIAFLLAMLDVSSFKGYWLTRTIGLHGANLTLSARKCAEKRVNKGTA
jgi:hypothetical protein